MQTRSSRARSSDAEQGQKSPVGACHRRGGGGTVGGWGGVEGGGGGVASRKPVGGEGSEKSKESKEAPKLSPADPLSRESSKAHTAQPRRASGVKPRDDALRALKQKPRQALEDTLAAGSFVGSNFPVQTDIYKLLCTDYIYPSPPSPVQPRSPSGPGRRHRPSPPCPGCRFWKQLHFTEKMSIEQ